MIQLFPERAATGQLRFVRSQRASLALGVLFAIGAIASWLLMPDTPVRLVFTAMAGAAGVRFLLAAISPYELTIDLESRTWRRRSGLALSPRTAAGSLDDLAGVVLDLRHVTTGSGSSRRTIPMWSISLEFTGSAWDGTPLVIGLVDRDEPRAYRLLEHYARKLRVDAIDRTAVREIRRAWNALDAQPSLPPLAATGALASIGRDGFAGATPPEGSGIEVVIEGERTRIVLPQHGASVGTVLGVVFCAIFGASGAVFVLNGLGFGPFADGAIEPIRIAVGGVFVWVAVGGITAALSRARSREWVIESADSLRFGLTRGGQPQAWTELPKRLIEEVSIRTPSEGGSRLFIMGVRIPLASPSLIRVRTNTDVVRIGNRLPPEAQQWLRNAIASAAGVPAA